MLQHNYQILLLKVQSVNLIQLERCSVYQKFMLALPSEISNLIYLKFHVAYKYLNHNGHLHNRIAGREQTKEVIFHF